MDEEAGADDEVQDDVEGGSDGGSDGGREIHPTELPSSAGGKAAGLAGRLVGFHAFALGVGYLFTCYVERRKGFMARQSSENEGVWASSPFQLILDVKSWKSSGSGET